MELIEIITILIAVFLVSLPVIQAIRNKKKGKSKCNCAGCTKNCAMRKRVEI